MSVNAKKNCPRRRNGEAKVEPPTDMSELRCELLFGVICCDVNEDYIVVFWTNPEQCRLQVIQMYICYRCLLRALFHSPFGTQNATRTIATHAGVFAVWH
jgi:hypothetical protein